LTADANYLKHILQAIQRIEEYTSVGRERFFRENHWQDATIRQLEIVGEAVKRLSPEVRSQSPATSWKDIAGMRDFLIHDYFGVDLETVWETSQRDIPELRSIVERLLSQL
jgi:uncharacterized protein with HEPN domain